MKRRSTKKSKAAELLITPPSPAATPIRSPSESPMIFKFNFTTPANSSLSLKSNRKSKNNNNSKKPDAVSPIATSPAPVISSPSKTRSRIADLKEMKSVHIDSIKRQIDCSYSDLLMDMEVSYSRLHKRYKAQNQACEQTMEEIEKDFKKMFDHMSQTHEKMEASCTDLIAEAQSRATRLCKTTIPEMKQSVEEAIGALRSHYGAASTSF